MKSKSYSSCETAFPGSAGGELCPDCIQPSVPNWWVPGLWVGQACQIPDPAEQLQLQCGKNGPGVYVQSMERLQKQAHTSQLTQGTNPKWPLKNRKRGDLWSQKISPLSPHSKRGPEHPEKRSRAHKHNLPSQFGQESSGSIFPPLSPG